MRPASFRSGRLKPHLWRARRTWRSSSSCCGSEATATRRGRRRWPQSGGWHLMLLCRLVTARPACTAVRAWYSMIPPDSGVHRFHRGGCDQERAQDESFSARKHWLVSAVCRDKGPSWRRKRQTCEVRALPRRKLWQHQMARSCRPRRGARNSRAAPRRSPCTRGSSRPSVSSACRRLPTPSRRASAAAGIATVARAALRADHGAPTADKGMRPLLAKDFAAHCSRRA